MALFGVKSAVRFGRVAIENVYQLSKTTYSRSSSSVSPLVRRNQPYSTVTQQQNADANATPSSDAELTENEKKLRLQLDAVNNELNQFKERSSELENKYKRSLADGENLRVRLTKQIQDAKLFGIQEFCKDLLEVADILGKATESVPKDELTEKNPHLKSLYEGLSMTEAQLRKVFTKHGVVVLNPIDEKFDPNQHEALFQQEVEGKAPGTVVVVSKVGYKLHERVVRPALVGVSKA